MATERDFQDKVITLARLYGWRVHHVRPGMTSRGRWLTNVQGNVGFPDLVLAHDKHGVIFAELKSDTGRLTEEQKDWLYTLNVTGHEAWVWRPAQLENITNRLRGKQWQID